ncbi:Os01g0141450 [Oryza sativa Japonica Group]|uniref:Os01g0141450 protein n=1 Tax=Oryza sativa subsp. japonica TaxID=39947 RepID=A0A0P0UXW4_ORYSJ|nr:Os01g0141450 [Oryza sativa Japonica Group]
MAASCSASLALSKPATSLHLTLGFAATMADLSMPLGLACSESPPPPPPPMCPSRTARISSARRRYSVNLAAMASLILGSFSYLRWVLKYSRAFM